MIASCSLQLWVQEHNPWSKPLDCKSPWFSPEASLRGVFFCPPEPLHVHPVFFFFCILKCWWTNWMKKLNVSADKQNSFIGFQCAGKLQCGKMFAIFGIHKFVISSNKQLTNIFSLCSASPKESFTWSCVNLRRRSLCARACRYMRSHVYKCANVY